MYVHFVFGYPCTSLVSRCSCSTVPSPKVDRYNVVQYLNPNFCSVYRRANDHQCIFSHYLKVTDVYSLFLPNTNVMELLGPCCILCSTCADLVQADDLHTVRQHCGPLHMTGHCKMLAIDRPLPGLFLFSHVPLSWVEPVCALGLFGSAPTKSLVQNWVAPEDKPHFQA